MSQTYFLLRILASQNATVLLSSLSMKSRKRLAQDVIYILPHIPSLFMTSQTHTGRHKMATLTAFFWRLSNVSFLFLFFYNNKTINLLKTAVSLLSLLSLSLLVVVVVAVLLLFCFRISVILFGVPIKIFSPRETGPFPHGNHLRHGVV